MELEHHPRKDLLKIGSTLQGGRYEIIKRLSGMNDQGGGCVYLARIAIMLPSGPRYREVAIKQVYDLPNLERVFNNEVRQLAKVQNVRGIPYLIDSFKAPEYQSWILVMEYVAGASLATMLRDNRHALSVRRVLEWICDLLNTLEELHNNQFVHKDIKPANIAIPHLGRTYTVLLDFGFTKQIGQTDPTLLGGTRRYASPEQFDPKHEREIGSRSDLYSVAATLYVLLTGDEGVMPFADGRILHDTLKPLRDHPRLQEKIEKKVEVLEALDNIVMRALSPNIKDRPASAAEMREVLEGVIKQMPEATFSIGTPVGNYKISQLVDLGSMSTIYKGQPHADPNSPTVTLLYFVRGSQPDATTVTSLIERGNKLDVPQISTILAAIDDKARNGTWYRLKYAPGRPLADMRSDQPSQGRIICWLDEGLEALGALHALGETIGSVNPWSIAVDAANQVMLLDWGPLIAGHYPYDLTPYTSPEVQQGATPTEQSDLFGLGSSFYELCGGTLAGDNGTEQLNASPYLIAILRQAMADDPTQRFPNTATMRQALKSLLQAEQLRSNVKKQGIETVIVPTGEHDEYGSPPMPGEPAQIIPIVLKTATVIEELHHVLPSSVNWSLDRHAIRVFSDGSVQLVIDLLRTSETDAQLEERQLLEDCLPSDLAPTPLARDQFLLAAITYYLLTKEVPWSADERQRRMARGNRDPLQFTSHGLDNIPPPVANAVMTALAVPPQIDADLIAWQKQLNVWIHPLESWREVYVLRQRLTTNPAASRIVVYADQMEQALARKLIGYELITRPLPSCITVITMVSGIAEALDAIPRDDVPDIGALHPKVRVQLNTGDARLLLDLGLHDAEQSGAPVAPEVQRTKEQGSATNQFNLAALTFFALTGEWPRVPTESDATNDVFLKRLTRDLKDGNSRFEKAQCRTAEVINVAMRFDPADRYDNCSVFAYHLRRAMQVDGVLE